MITNLQVTTNALCLWKIFLWAFNKINEMTYIRFMKYQRVDLLLPYPLVLCFISHSLTVDLLLCSVKIRDFQLFQNHLVVHEREGGLLRVVVYRLPDIELPLGNLSEGRNVDFVDPVYDVHSLESEFSSNVLRFSYSSLRTPPSVYDYDMDSGESVLKKTDTVSILFICLSYHFCRFYLRFYFCFLFFLL